MLNTPSVHLKKKKKAISNKKWSVAEVFDFVRRLSALASKVQG